MSTGSVQYRNPEMYSVLQADLESKYAAQSHPANLIGAVECMHRAWDGTEHGGGPIMYGWLADREAISTRVGSQQLTTAAIALSDFSASDNGGPYVDLNGTNEHLRIADAAWQEGGIEEFFVWHWCNTTTLASTQTIASKYDTNGNNCSWRLIFDSVTGNFQFVVNGTGNPANDVPVGVAYTEAVDTWYFVAGYYYASTIIRAWVGAASDLYLTVATVAAGVPAALFNGNAPLAIGTSFNNSPTMLNPWSGLIGVGGARFNTPAGTAASYDEVNGFATRLFQMTRWHYMA